MWLVESQTKDYSVLHNIQYLTIQFEQCVIYCIICNVLNDDYLHTYQEIPLNILTHLTHFNTIGHILATNVLKRVQVC